MLLSLYKYTLTLSHPVYTVLYVYTVCTCNVQACKVPRGDKSGQMTGDRSSCLTQLRLLHSCMMRGSSNMFTPFFPSQVRVVPQ